MWYSLKYRLLYRDQSNRVSSNPFQAKASYLRRKRKTTAYNPIGTSAYAYRRRTQTDKQTFPPFVQLIQKSIVRRLQRYVGCVRFVDVWGSIGAAISHLRTGGQLRKRKGK